jgi:lysozyme
VSDTTRPRLKVSRAGIVLIKSFEGFRPYAVPGEDGGWVIGYGHTASAREGLTVGEQDAELLLQYDLMPVVKALNEQVAAPLNQHQFDALASFVVSVGVDRFAASDVLKRLNNGHAGEAADALVGWPETVGPEAALRRRAAERALFVADPASPVMLADLLAAPLPPPPVETAPVETTPEPPPVIRPEFVPPAADARAAAVASLLGEADEAHAHRAAAEVEVTEAIRAEADAVEAMPEPIIPAPQNWSPQPPAFAQPVAVEASLNLQRYSPYAAAIIGPLPGLAPHAPAQSAEVVAPAQPEVSAFPETVAVAATLAAPVAVAPLVPPAPGPSPFPPMEELVLTPAVEADFVEADPRASWTPEERYGPAAGEVALFTDEPALSVLRHEVEPAPARRLDWIETGPFLIMGAVGLVACGASAAAFRIASDQPSDMGETMLIAWVLAGIGAICVGVSSWNLYVRAGKAS